MGNTCSKKFLSFLVIVALFLSNFSGIFSAGVQAEEPPVLAEDLFISEYMEGSSNNKAIEIFNGTGNDVDLSQYSLELYSNGAATATSKLSLSGTLLNQDVYIVANGSANEFIKAQADKTAAVSNFNGNDAIVLKKNETIIDVFGQVGADPGSSWGTGDYTTVDHTLVRKEAVIRGDKVAGDAFDPSLEWNSNPKDYTGDLGKHTFNGQPGTDPGTDPDPQPDPVAGVLSIAAAKSKNGQTVTIEGVVTADNSTIGGGKLSTYIQDDTAGINVFDNSSEGFPHLKEGNKVKITGSITSYRSLIEIKPSSIEVLSQNAELPQPKAMTLADFQDSSKAEPNEGQLVKVTGFIESIPSTPSGGGYNISFIDENYHSAILRVIEGSIDVNQLQAGKWYEATAILSQYNDYQLIPRKAADLKLADPQPEAPKLSGEFESTIASVVDGDTVHLTSPVLGSTKVRFVNIDTPETYHKVVTEADRSQKEHGEAAKAYLNSLLKAGDEVKVIVGDEAKDDYGRLLAQIVRKSDHVNTNLEMVRQGYASTYFIWPIGAAADYEKFQTAVKEAKDNGRGIWDPANPLEELPFAFRAREQGKGFARYVGDYSTKTYVSPEKWEEVPVEKRVFFASDQEAESNGYKKAGATYDSVLVQLLSVNDLHGKIDVTGTANNVQYGRADYLAAYLRAREATNPNTLIVHSGDMIGGSSPVSALVQDEPTVEIMESIGFDVGTVGNHEFDEGTKELVRMVKGGDHPNGTKGYDGINFPTVAANVEYKNTGELVLQPYAIKEIAGEKIGFIGVATVDTPNMVMASGIQDIRFTDEQTAVNKYTAELKAQGIKAIVVLAHVPGNQSGEAASGEIAGLATGVDDEVDVIIAAHNHVKVDAVVDNKLIVQAWEYGKSFGDIDLEIDPATGDVIKKTADVVDVVQQGITPDPEVSAILAKYTEMVGPTLNQVVGTAAVPMQGGYAKKGMIGDNALGNLIADGMNYEMKSDFALMNGGGIRDILNDGDITWEELFNIQPFNNTLITVTITGAELEPILNAQFSSYGPDVSIGGFTYTWDSKTNKVVNIYLPDGTPVDPDRTYTLTVNNYMYEHSSDKYKIRQYGENPVQGPEDLAATVNFVKSFKEPIHYVAEGRISEDIEAPVLNEAVLPEPSFRDGSYLHEMKITVNATDSGIGVSHIEYSLDNGVTWTRYTDGIAVNQDGKSKILYRAFDKVHNVSKTKAVEVNVKSATLENTEKLVAAADAVNGVKKSIIVQLQIADRTLEREKTHKITEDIAYKSLEKLSKRIKHYPKQLMSAEDKNEITEMIDYITEHRTESKR
ncbi:5'-nucleotidase C-terminal domain-containing protein [Peribacillus glennii]|uniref:Endonuclease n=1 Tax=Peribacillus glennii TaxID=2303991 RepID=A0A372LA31_9BACI|nr:5'-nucleotidase C-terminal domain-containing protein [Peribacillus glennii]RFU62454.1 endonuclease [Peribacillus glennii]